MTDDATKPTPPTLEYSNRRPLSWVARHRKLLIFLAFSLAIAGPTWWYWQPLKARVLWQYWNHRAATYVMPASGELVIGDPGRAAVLLSTNPDYVPASMAASATQPAVAGAIHFPKAVRELQKFDSRVNLIVSPSARSPGPIAFVGTLRRPDGISRLVLLPQGGLPYQGIDRLPVAVIPLPGWLDPVPGGNIVYRVYGFTGMGNGHIEYLKLEASSRDSADPTHLVVPFTITVDAIFNNKPATVLETGTFDVYLRDDDSLLFRMRADATRSIALRLKKETVVNGSRQGSSK